jgi:hypothetical protein
MKGQIILKDYDVSPIEKAYLSFMCLIEPISFYDKFKSLKWFSPEKNYVISIHNKKIKVYKVMKFKKPHRRSFNLMHNDIEEWFGLSLRGYFKYCSNCGKKLDLPWSDFHIPLCQKCRRLQIDDIKNKWLK